MILMVGGTVLVAASLFYLGFKLHIAYSVAKSPESAGGVPTLDGVIFPPIFCTWGVWFIASEVEQLHMSGWGALAIWLILTAIAFVGMIGATSAGRRQRDKIR